MGMLQLTPCQDAQVVDNILLRLFHVMHKKELGHWLGQVVSYMRKQEPLGEEYPQKRCCPW